MFETIRRRTDIEPTRNPNLWMKPSLWKAFAQSSFSR